jgi:hypothetical protein
MLQSSEGVSVVTVVSNYTLISSHCKENLSSSKPLRASSPAALCQIPRYALGPWSATGNQTKGSSTIAEFLQHESEKHSQDETQDEANVKAFFGKAGARLCNNKI